MEPTSWSTRQLVNWATGQVSSLETWQLTARTRSFDAIVKYVSLQLRLDEWTSGRSDASIHINLTRRVGSLDKLSLSTARDETSLTWASAAGTAPLHSSRCWQPLPHIQHSCPKACVTLKQLWYEWKSSIIYTNSSCDAQQRTHTHTRRIAATQSDCIFHNSTSFD